MSNELLGFDCRIARQMPKLSTVNARNSDKTLKIEKILPILKVLPIDNTLPVLAMLKILPVLHMDKMLPTLTIDKMLPKLHRLRILPMFRLFCMAFISVFSLCPLCLCGKTLCIDLGGSILA